MSLHMDSWYSWLSREVNTLRVAGSSPAEFMPMVLEIFWSVLKPGFLLIGDFGGFSSPPLC